MGLLVAAFLIWPPPTFVAIVLLLPAAALLFPILESGRYRKRVVWRAFGVYSGLAYVAGFTAVTVWSPSLFPLLLLFPFLASLVVLVREALPS